MSDCWTSQSNRSAGKRSEAFMNIKVTVNHKLTVNGKEYGSLDEMPEDLRQAYERAVGSDQGIAGLAKRASKNAVFVPASRIETSVPALDQPRGFSIELKIGNSGLRLGKSGLLLVLAVLLLILWYALNGPSR